MPTKKKKIKITKRDINRFKKWKEKGLSYQQIALKTGFSMYTIMYHISPTYNKSMRERRNKHYRKNKNAKKKRRTKM